MSTPFVLADDLSGALEAGAAFRLRGWTATLPLAESAPSSRPNHVDIYSTETRNLAEREAAAIVRRVLAERRDAGARLLFKKIDSTLRGALGAELTALAAELAPPLIVVCPANPPAGRTVRGGMLCVDDVPLEQTAFRSDPTWPAATGDVRVRLAAQGVTVHAHLGIDTIARGAAAISAALAESRERCAGPLIVTSDALTQFDLRAIVEGTLTAEASAVLIGSGALGPVIAERMPAAVNAPTRATATAAEAGLVVLCGSRHPLSHRQIDMLVRTCGALDLITQPGAELAPLIEQLIAALDARRAVAVRCDPLVPIGSSEAVPRWLAEVAAALVARRRPGVLALTGGETAFAVCRRVGGLRLDIIDAIRPGMVRANLVLASGVALSVISKPGGYGEPNCWVEVSPVPVK